MKIIICESGAEFLLNKDNLLWAIPKESYGKKLKPVFTGQWRLQGFAPIKPFGRIGAVIKPEDMTMEDLRYKNGKGRFEAIDCDHGTFRIWGNRPLFFLDASQVFTPAAFES